MMFWKPVLLAWNWEPSIIIGCVGLLLGYAILARWRGTGRGAYFIAGVVVLFLALASPIEAISENYLFSMHMFQHVLLSDVVAPLLLLGIPAAWWTALLRVRGVGGAERVLSKPVLAWIIGLGGLWIWHWPPLFGLAMQHESLHILNHLCFIATGCIFWWPVLSPLPRRRLTTFPAVFYLFTACTASSLLGMWITFSALELYPSYGSGMDPLGILAGVRARISLHADQQLGGLLMWAPCCLIYASAILVTLGRWQAAEETGGRILAEATPARAL